MRTVIFSTLGVDGTYGLRDLQSGEKVDARNPLVRIDFTPVMHGVRFAARLTFQGVDGYPGRTENVYVITAGVP